MVVGVMTEKMEQKEKEAKKKNSYLKINFFFVKFKKKNSGQDGQDNHDMFFTMNGYSNESINISGSFNGDLLLNKGFILINGKGGDGGIFFICFSINFQNIFLYLGDGGR